MYMIVIITQIRAKLPLKLILGEERVSIITKLLEVECM